MKKPKTQTLRKLNGHPCLSQELVEKQHQNQPHAFRSCVLSEWSVHFQDFKSEFSHVLIPQQVPCLSWFLPKWTRKTRPLVLRHTVHECTNNIPFKYNWFKSRQSATKCQRQLQNLPHNSVPRIELDKWEVRICLFSLFSLSLSLYLDDFSETPSLQDNFECGIDVKVSSAHASIQNLGTKLSTNESAGFQEHSLVTSNHNLRTIQSCKFNV